MEIEDVDPFSVVEVSFKNGARKGFYYNQPFTRASTGDMVVVDTQSGFDIGRITLSGELVRLQMRKKRVPENGFFPKVVRKANERDLEKFVEIRNIEKTTMIKARAIAATLRLNMKVGDVEFQADGRKATFYYTADGRVDFRELIRHYAKEFKVKIEMRQIGARQESARIGGVGPCGRELCCSTWLTSFRTVSTAAARYQNLAINQAKLSGQCGRLKCCLNYELNTYMEALDSFPEDAEKLRTQVGVATLVKTDIFKGLMYYQYEHDNGRGRLYTLDLAQVRSIRDKNARREFPPDLVDYQVAAEMEKEAEPDFEDVTGAIELPPEERHRRKKKKKNKGSGRDESKSPEVKTSEKEGSSQGKKKQGKGRDRRDKEKREPTQPNQQPNAQAQAPKPEGEKKSGGRNKGRGRDRRGRGGKNRNNKDIK
jgi:cell fate regulator YaaT (PSP1 superfamily)